MIRVGILWLGPRNVSELWSDLASVDQAIAFTQPALRGHVWIEDPARPAVLVDEPLEVRGWIAKTPRRAS